MKNSVIATLFVGLVASLNGQIYERTGRNFGIYASVQPMSRMGEKLSASAPNSISGNIGFIQMVYPGIFPMLGYSFQQFQKNTFRSGQTSAFQNAHTIDAALLFDKRLVKLLNGRRVLGGCHYLSLGLIIGPEYHYMFGNRTIKNYAFGEVGGQLGFSFYHFKRSMRKSVQAKTRQYDLFYRRGFTPIFVSQDSGAQSKLFRDEIGIRIRFISHQVANFLQ